MRWGNGRSEHFGLDGWPVTQTQITDGWTALKKTHYTEKMKCVYVFRDN